MNKLEKIMFITAHVIFSVVWVSVFLFANFIYFSFLFSHSLESYTCDFIFLEFLCVSGVLILDICFFFSMKMIVYDFWEFINETS